MIILPLVKYGAGPLLTLVGSQVPAISALLLRWIQPGIASLRFSASPWKARDTSSHRVE